MSEELQGGYQTTTETQVTEPIQTQEPVTTQEPNYFEVKYNKEPVKVSYDEAPTYIQKGLNYDKVQQQAETYQQQLDRAAKLAGYQSHDELIKALDDLEQQQQREEYEQAGLNPDVLNKFLENHPAIQYAKQMEQQQQEQQKFQSEVNELFQEFPDLKPEQIPAEVWQLKESKGLSLLDSYLRVSYKSLGQQKEQEAIQKLQQNAQSSTGSLGAGGEHQTPSVSNMSKAEFENLIQRVKRGERVEL